MNFFELNIDNLASEASGALGPEKINFILPFASAIGIPVGSVQSMQLVSIVSLGIFHGILFSLPFSTSIFISLRSFFLEGFQKGCFAFAGSLLGQLSFFYLIFFGSRSLIQGWYCIEPFLAFFGIALSIKLATTFFHQKTFSWDTPLADPLSASREAAIGSSPDLQSTQGGDRGAFVGRISQLLSNARVYFSAQSERRQASILQNSLTKFISPIPKIFFFQFFLIFLNPVFPGTASRILLGQDSFEIFTSKITLLVYSLTFIVTAGFFIFSLYFVVNNFASLISGISQVAAKSVVGKARLSPILSSEQSSFLTKPQSNPFGDRVTREAGNNFWSNKLSLSTWFTNDSFGLSILGPQSSIEFANKIFVFLIIGTVLQGSVLYSWRLFVQYPVEFLGSRGTAPLVAPLAGERLVSERPFNAAKRETPLISSFSNSISNFSNNLSENLPIGREFPSFDSSIRHREKNLPLDRHIPVEKVNSRRILNGKPPLSEEQKSDAYVKYNSFLLNKMDQSFDNFKIRIRSFIPSSNSATLSNTSYDSYEDILHLQIIKKRYLKGQASTGRGFSSAGLPTALNKVELNVTKGKPKLSYIQELVEKQSQSQGFVSGHTQHRNNLENSYLHDDLQIYNSVFRFLGSS